MIRAVEYIKNLFTRSASIRNPDHWFNQARTRIDVSNNIALKVSTVYACNKVLAETIGALPLKCYQRADNDGGKEPYSTYFLAKILRRPNALQTTSEFLETLVSQINLRGNYYAGINYDRGYVSGLIPFNPVLMDPEIKNNVILYKYNHENGPLKIYPQSRIFHVRNLTLDGLNGLSPIAYAKKGINLALESEDHGYYYFKNGTRASGFLQHPGTLKGQAHENLRKSWNKKMSGEEKFKIQILEEGMAWQPASLSNEDAQYLQTRQFQVEDIARWYRVPLELLQHPAKTSSYASVEQFMLSFVVHTLTPWVKKIENRINYDLVPIEDQDNIFFEFKLDGLLRGDIQSRYRAYATGRQWGWLSVDDVRGFENMNPLPSGTGKKYLMPLNMEDVENPREKKGEK